MRKTISHRGISRTAVIVIIVVCAGLFVSLTCVGVLGALLIPSLSEARQQAQLLKSEIQIRMIGQALLVQQNEDDDGVMEISFGRLVAEEYLSPEIFDSPVGDATDGGDDYWAYPEPIEFALTDDWDRLVIIYDRAAYEAGDRIPVGFLHAPTEVLTRAEFEQLIAQPPNGAVDYDLPAHAR